MLPPTGKRPLGSKCQLAFQRYLYFLNHIIKIGSPLRVGSPANILAVAKRPGHDMVMDMEDILLAFAPIAINNLQVVNTQFLPIVFGEFAHHRNDFAQILIRYIEDILVMLFRDHQRMITAHRIDIQESVNMFIFVNLPGGRGARYNLTKDAVRHGFRCWSKTKYIAVAQKTGIIIDLSKDIIYKAIY